MGQQARDLPDGVAMTMPLPKRLTFVVILLLLQIYSLSLSVYKVSHEKITEDEIKSKRLRRLMNFIFLSFPRRKRTQRHRQETRTQPNELHLMRAEEDHLSRHSVESSSKLRSNGRGIDSVPAGLRCGFKGTRLRYAPSGLHLRRPYSAAIFGTLSAALEGLNAANCTAPIDGDIAGDGVHTPLWVQQGILWLSVLTGPFLKPSQPRATAVKELAAGLVLTHLSLGMAVVVQIGQRTLTPLDAALVVMILDAQHAALAVSLSSRETLAARWGVVCITASQCFGLVVIGLVLVTLEGGSLYTEECSCFSWFWWAWRSTCADGKSLPDAERLVLWTYYAFRWLGSAQNWHFAVRYMWGFNYMEHDKERWDGVRPNPDSPEGKHGVPATVGFGFTQNLMLGL
ncbi:hypothetical protein QBC34DRAFT_493993 [Podospora aff. communis PSN243]|uniref:Uncharacterized protein n=1 Tax=Podospora aff. communis PSN243 TaxID=3040156 RepID=A0AAV9GQX4_9PEZI|nr:hypothetical protein QBC34DRAFT_493993 [Podospora aff. communis PSN243]